VLSKTLLPWFGGTSAVWSAAMLYFQFMLILGYAYSNWLVKKKDPRKQTAVHLVILIASVCLVIFLWIVWPSPITPAENFKSGNIVHPILSLFFLLTISVGLPFFVLSTNSPLMQVWFNRKNAGRSPYWLYALSNIGSLLGLLIYPIVIEPLLTIRWQGWLWAGGYLIFAILAAYNSVQAAKTSRQPVTVKAETVSDNVRRSKTRDPLMWILLSACASLLLLAVTNQITQDVAAIPFLWVLPLIIYLLSFVLTFSNRSLYNRKVFTIFLILGTLGCGYIFIAPLTGIILQIFIYSFFLFAAAMICNGELYALRPQASQLTRFYLMGAIGGAIGGFVVNFVAPYLFRGYWELYLGLAFVWILLSIVFYSRTGKPSEIRFGALIGAMSDVVVILMVILIIYSASGNLFVHRNFYGVVYVRQREIETDHQKANVLVHGSTLHGFQYLDANLRDTPTSYYSKYSGVGLAFLNNPHRASGMRVGVLGLGVGTLAAYGQAGDYYRFYEINPAVVDLAKGQNGYFSFINDSQATVDIVVGDARLSLEKELNAGVKNNFDILVLDTFSSDSIPVHLVTKEAFAIYLQNLAPDGLIAAHISNEHLDLRPVFWQLAQFYDLDIAIVQTPDGGNDPAATPSVWVLLTRNPNLFEAPALANKLDSMDGFRTDTRLWTDDYSNLIQLLR
jgi:hypothetical protein